MRKSAIAASIGVLTVLPLYILAGATLAYNTYSGSECETCHPGFVNQGSLHDVHVNALTNNCDMCHPSGAGSTPVLTYSAGDATALSCLGCHGRDYGATGVQSAGLRLFHATANPPVDCSGCHSDPTPLDESVVPPHYGRADVTLVDSCSDNLDNDGDRAVDSADDNCNAPPVVQSTWGEIKALFATR